MSVGCGGHGFGFDHQPFFCEENVWRLCRHPLVAKGDVLVAIVSSLSGSVRVKRQTIAGGQHVDWDYHVLLFSRGHAGSPWQAWDLDSTLGAPVAAGDYLAAAFAEPIPVELRPLFRVMGGAAYHATLSSDRSHMRRDGIWLHAPPPWPAPLQGEPNLLAMVAMDRPTPGEVMDLAELRARLA